MNLIVKSMRPRQWSKNLLLFAGIFFSQNFFDPTMLGRAVGGFVVFCLLSGAIYLLNDIADIEHDRLHPAKAKRPIALGELSVATARGAAFWIATAGVIGAFMLSWYFGICALAYLGMMLAYVYGLKHVFLIDTLLIAMGFIIRAVSGVIVLRVSDGPEVPLTPWFVICVMFLSLILALGKRRAEAISVSVHGMQTRPVLNDYSQILVDLVIGVCTAGALLSYALYCMTTPLPWEMLSTMPFVIFGLFRYLHLLFNRNEGETPENLLTRDGTIIGCVVIWAILIAVLKSLG